MITFYRKSSIYLWLDFRLCTETNQIDWISKDLETVYLHFSICINLQYSLGRWSLCLPLKKYWNNETILQLLPSCSKNASKCGSRKWYCAQWHILERFWLMAKLVKSIWIPTISVFLLPTIYNIFIIFRKFLVTNRKK